jgi:hypothetical protein
MLTSPDSGRQKIIYIAGWGRSGTTILGNLLGQLPGFFHLGELRLLWEQLQEDGARCGCNRPPRDCPFWSRVLERLYGESSATDYAELIRLRDGASRTRYTPLMIWPMGRRMLQSRLAGYLTVLSDLYAAIAAESGAKIHVDSSKTPGHGYLLTLLPRVEIHLVHLIRDPRATAFSWSRRTVHAGPDDRTNPPRCGILKNALLWVARNQSIARLWSRSRSIASYQLLRYEDLAQRPRPILSELLAGFGETHVPSLRFQEDEVWLDEVHTISGNPVRFRRGKVKVRPDLEWERAMPGRDYWLTTALTWPLLRRYGYGKQSSPDPIIPA